MPDENPGSGKPGKHKSPLGGGDSKYPYTYTVGGVTYRVDLVGGHLHYTVISGGGGGGSSGGYSGGYSGGGGGFSAGPALTTITGRQLSDAELKGLMADYKHIGTLYGINVTSAIARHAAQMDLSSQEFLQRAQVIQKINENRVFFNEFSNTLIRQGIKNKPLSRAEERQFVLGTSPSTFYKVWEQASVRAGLANAGLQVGHGKGTVSGDTAVSQSFVTQLMNHIGRDAVLSGSSTVNEVYGRIAQDLINVIPEAQYQNFGLSKRDLINLETGGPNQLALAQRVRQIMANANAADRTTVTNAPLGQASGYTSGSA